ncbi:MAG: type II secretion system minor pseudopilin GspI [Pseudomonadota bacterium]
MRTAITVRTRNAQNAQSAQSGQKGITLIEVMVALAILAILAGGVLALISQNTRFAIASEERLSASIIADNIMVEQMVRTTPFEEGEEVFERDFDGRTWSCIQTVTNVGAGGLQRIDLTVRPKGSPQILAAVSTLRPIGTTQ